MALDDRMHAMDGVTCRSCGASNPGGFRFCGTCGTDLSPGGAIEGYEPEPFRSLA
jgi:zinc ribbon protein